MDLKQKIEAEIKAIEDNYGHVLDRYPQDIIVNGVVAIMQITAKAQLDVLYKLLGKKRPKVKADDMKKLNH